MLRSLLTLALLTPLLPAADWPIFRGTPDGLGVADAKLPDQLDERWRFKTGNAIEGAPAIVDGVVYIGSADKHFYAIDLKTGQQKWKVGLGSPVQASPAVRKGRVYVGTADGKLFCVNAADGAKVWEFTVEGAIKSGVNFHGENVLLGSRDIPLYCVGPDGKKVWEFAIDGGSNGTPTVVGDRTFVAGCDSVFHILDAKTGKEISNLYLDDQAAATTAVFGDTAYVGTMGKSQVVAIDLKAAKKVWWFEAPRRQQPFYSSAAVTDKLVVTASEDKKVYALDRQFGKEKWHFATDGMVDGSPVIVGERVYVGCLSNDGNFYALDLKTGRKVQEINLDSAVTGSPAVGPDCILIGTEKGSLYCLGAK
ncbi:outer membrane protein assembly factor BamB family protein [Limnoglobus roseus]|uniref:Pyrrolo-quinoline quinone n=1 Tax=Limnoglobus roseus TaxID=2598579 RepID=A0A5C1AE28_9BACT|nr:PQQ-binding-like beta-propeller repeat protein [Limnoglobus roseus]QEL16970.1 pyrrolo-quinoline quinone [Limnoglobus roseus]